MMRVAIFIVAIATIFPLWRSMAQSSVESELNALEPAIGQFPPNIHSDADRARIIARYDTVLDSLNNALSKTPDDMDLLFARGKLQAMGHNLDRPDAFHGAESDLSRVIAAQPRREAALIELGRLYVNTSPQLAPRAETLFGMAQIAHGDVPLEDAQSGLFFAYYYQGQMDRALIQSNYLIDHWPQREQYKKLHSVVEAVISRGKK